MFARFFTLCVGVLLSALVLAEELTPSLSIENEESDLHSHGDVEKVIELPSALFMKDLEGVYEMTVTVFRHSIVSCITLRGDGHVTLTEKKEENGELKKKKCEGISSLEEGATLAMSMQCEGRDREYNLQVKLGGVDFTQNEFKAPLIYLGKYGFRKTLGSTFRRGFCQTSG